MSEGILKSVNSREVNSLVSSPTVASGNRLRENIQDFESLSETVQFTKVCEGPSFDGFGDPIPVCREYTLSQAIPRARAYAARPGETINGPVIKVHVTHGLESKFHLQLIQNGHLGF